MKVLIFDCSGDVATVAVYEGGSILSRASVGGKKNHAAVLLPCIDECIRDAGTKMQEISEIYVCSGPGSFTGVKVAIATALGLADPSGIPVFVFPYYALVLARLLDEKPLALSAREVVLGIDAGRGGKYCTYVANGALQDGAGLAAADGSDAGMPAVISTLRSALVKSDSAEFAAFTDSDTVYAEYADLHCELLFRLPEDIRRQMVSSDVEPLYFRKSQAEEALEERLA